MDEQESPLGRSVIHQNPFLARQLGEGLVVAWANRNRGLVKVVWSGEATLTHYVTSLRYLEGPETVEPVKEIGLAVTLDISQEIIVYGVGEHVDKIVSQVTERISSLFDEVVFSENPLDTQKPSVTVMDVDIVSAKKARKRSDKVFRYNPEIEKNEFLFNL